MQSCQVNFFMALTCNFGWTQLLKWISKQSTGAQTFKSWTQHRVEEYMKFLTSADPLQTDLKLSLNETSFRSKTPRSIKVDHLLTSLGTLALICERLEKKDLELANEYNLFFWSTTCTCLSVWILKCRVKFDGWLTHKNRNAASGSHRASYMYRSGARNKREEKRKQGPGILHAACINHSLRLFHLVLDKEGYSTDLQTQHRDTGGWNTLCYIPNCYYDIRDRILK